MTSHQDIDQQLEVLQTEITQLQIETDHIIALSYVQNQRLQEIIAADLRMERQRRNPVLVFLRRLFGTARF